MTEITMTEQERAENFFREIIPKIDEIRKVAKENGINHYVNIAVSSDGYTNASVCLDDGEAVEIYRMDPGKYTIRIEKSFS